MYRIGHGDCFLIAFAGEKPDIDKIAADVYAEVLRLIDIARERSGDPWV